MKTLILLFCLFLIGCSENPVTKKDIPETDTFARNKLIIEYGKITEYADSIFISQGEWITVWRNGISHGLLNDSVKIK